MTERGRSEVDIGAWLRGLGLERYEGTFRDNAIDAEVLPDLTDADLEKLGVLLGHRKRLLRAIAELREPFAEQDAPAPAAPAREPAAERRQVTVLFCDLVGSTALATRLDPEDLREVIGGYHRCVAEVVGRWDGHVAKYMGDGVLVYFGYPKAHEDEAERAVRAGLALVEAVGDLASQERLALRARIGIATGLVVVGETPNLAARLQALADPDTVVIAPSTRRLVGGLFELAALGAHDLKGFAAPVPAWRVLRPSRVEGRFEARQAAGLTPLVGRDEELALLLSRWERAKDGEGQVVLLSGEPGIGKSRLIRGLRERLAEQTHTPLSHFCSPFHQNTALHPVIGLLERAAGLSRTDPPEQQIEKVEALLALAAEDVQEVAPLLADLLSIPTGNRDPPLDLTPQRRKERTLQALVDQLAGLAAQRPVLALYEDAHWIDPTTAELIGLVVERVRGLPVLVVITFRPEFSPPWRGHAHVTALSLSRLSRHQSGALVERVTNGKALPREVLEEIVARTDGVPLFVEELTKAVLESGVLDDRGDRYVLRGPLPPLAVPATLQDSLTARLDRLAPVKEVAQTAAVIGREFSHDLLAALAPLHGQALTGALNTLVAAELIFRRGVPPDASYVFKHALVQEVAYQSLLRGKRQRLHAHIAEVLEERFPATVETEPELLAHHCTRAGLVEKAVMYRYQAAQRALARSTLAEAVAQLRQGLDALAGLPDGPERRRRELDLQVALGGALIGARGYAAAETGRAFARARELCREEGDVQRLLPVMNGQVLFHSQRGEPNAAYGIAEEMLEVAQRQGDSALLIPAHRALSLTSLHLGRFAAAREHAERVLALYDPVRHRGLASLYAFDQRVVALGYLAWALFALGYPGQARRRSQEAVAEAQKLSHPNTLAQALHFACLFRFTAREAKGLRELAETLIGVAREHGLAHFLAVGTVMRGWVLVEQGRAEEGLADLEHGAAAIRAGGTRAMLPYTSALLAEAHVLAGQAREAVGRAAEALARTRKGSSFWYEAEAHRLSGETLLLLPAPNQAEAEVCFRRAIEVARVQDARMWQLRAATSLARLWRDQGRRREAYDLLAPLYGWFTEGFGTPDLKDANMLLDELR